MLGMYFSEFFVKAQLFWEGHKNLELSPTWFDVYSKFLWPSQKSWTLPFRCVPKSKCGGNKVSRRSSGILGLQIAAADEAKCDNDSDVCCSEKEITQECSDYAQDGYKCVSTCYDVPQDFPSKDERKTIISPYLPKVLKSIIFPEELSICQQRGGWGQKHVNFYWFSVLFVLK